MDSIGIKISFSTNCFNLDISTVKTRSAGVFAPSDNNLSNKPFFACKTFTLIPVEFVNSSKNGLINIGCL